jgi:hypothetical protein
MQRRGYFLNADLHFCYSRRKLLKEKKIINLRRHALRMKPELYRAAEVSCKPMTIEQLARIEDELYISVMELYRSPMSVENSARLKNISQKYNEVHQEYSKQSSAKIKALKRGLFIQWYALTEPLFLTGIGDLDTGAQNRIISELQKLFKNNTFDYELVWMLNYYAEWEWCFDHLESFGGFDPRIVNMENRQLPISIDKHKMLTRGQMGRYWCSLTRFS